MEKSAAYIAYEKLLEAHRREGYFEGVKDLVIQFAKKRLGAPSRKVEEKMDMITASYDGCDLLERILKARTWDEFLADAR